MACWIWTFGSACSSIFDENAARKYRQALTKGLAICSRPTRDVDPAQAASSAPASSSIVSPRRGGFHRPTDHAGDRATPITSAFTPGSRGDADHRDRPARDGPAGEAHEPHGRRTLDR